MNLARAASTLVRCACGEWRPWVEVEEDPRAEQPGPYAAQICAVCGASLAATWLELRRSIVQRTELSRGSTFGLVGFAAIVAAAIAFPFGGRLLTEEAAGLGMAVVGFFAFMLVFFVGTQFPFFVPWLWGYGHGRCACGRWFRVTDRVDGFIHPAAPDDDYEWIAIWRCPGCERLSHSEVSFGSFV